MVNWNIKRRRKRDLSKTYMYIYNFQIYIFEVIMAENFKINDSKIILK